MNKTLIGVGIVLILVATGILWYFFVGSATPQTPSPGPSVSFPEGGTAPGSIGSTEVFEVENYQSEPVPTKNFIDNGVTAVDVENPGSYMLAGSVGYCLSDGTCPGGAPTTDFSISFNKNTNFFNIILLKEPLGTTRKEAEQFLLNELGTSQDQMCTLQYYVGTPYWINENFDNKNLGFSFCPGATALP